MEPLISWKCNLVQCIHRALCVLASWLSIKQTQPLFFFLKSILIRLCYQSEPGLIFSINLMAVKRPTGVEMNSPIGIKPLHRQDQFSTVWFCLEEEIPFR